MKLIEILVKKHNEEGWEWPENADMAEAFPHEKGWVNFWLNNESTSGGVSVRDWCPPQVDTVKHEQYEAALAASKEMLINKPQPVWNGDGLPPVGCECEAFDGVSWFPVVVVGRYDGFAFAWNYDYRKTLTVNEEHSNNFRPIRTEAERKREDIIDELVSVFISHHGNPKGAEGYRSIAVKLYDKVISKKTGGSR